MAVDWRCLELGGGSSEVAWLGSIVVDVAKERVKGSKLIAAIVHVNVPGQAEQLREIDLISIPMCWILYLRSLSSKAIHNGEGLIEFGFCGSEE